MLVAARTRRIDAGAPQTSPILFRAKMLPVCLRVDTGIVRRPAEQRVKSHDNGRYNRNHHPPMHCAIRPLKVFSPFRRAVRTAQASSKLRGKTISETGTIAYSQLSKRLKPLRALFHILINNLLAWRTRISYYPCIFSSQQQTKEPPQGDRRASEPAARTEPS